MAVATATPPVKPNTAKSGRRLNATGSEDGGSRETSRRVPQADKSTATKQPESARVKFSVNNCQAIRVRLAPRDRKSTRLNSSHGYISYAVFCLKKKKKYESSGASSVDTGAARSLSDVLDYRSSHSDGSKAFRIERAEALRLQCYGGRTVCVGPC